MSFLAPLFLWLLPLTAIPLIIHLLNRRNVITIDFSTLRFLKLLERESIRKLQLLQLLLLILRTIIILLLILMITRPVVKGIFNLQNSSESALHAVILDDSFSMRGNIDIIRNAAQNILIQIPDKNQLIWININAGVQFKGLKEDLPPLDDLLDFTYHAGTIMEALYTFDQNIEGDFTSKEVYILTDAQYSAIETIDNYPELLESLHSYALISPPLENNLSITQLNILNEILVPNHQIGIEVNMQNNGVSDIENVLLQLIINDMIVGQQLISLTAGSSKYFWFKTVLPNTGLFTGMVELDGDDKVGDNRFYFNLNIPDKHKIAIINKSQETSYYIKASLDALNKSGESLNISEYLNLYDNNLKLHEQDVVFIMDPDNLQNIMDSKIESYLYNGGHIILFPNLDSDASAFKYIQNITADILNNYDALVKNILSDNSFQEIDAGSIQSDEIQNLFTSGEGSNRNIKLFTYLQLPFDPEHSIMQLNDGSPVWNRYTIQNGILDVFGFAVNLKWTNFPIKGAFLPFTNFLLYSQALNSNTLYHNIGDDWNQILTEYYATTLYHVQPDGSREIVVSDENNSLSIHSLNSPGYHSLQTANFEIGTAAVNIPASELKSPLVSIDDLKEYMPEDMKIIPMEADIQTEIRQARIGVELWRYFLYAVIVCLIIEMILSNAKKQR